MSDLRLQIKMAARSTDVRILLIFIFINFMVRKPSFTTADSICFSVSSRDGTELKETFIYSSLWQYNQERSIKVSGRNFTVL